MKKGFGFLLISCLVLSQSCRSKQSQKDLDRMANSSVSQATTETDPSNMGALGERAANCSVQVITDMDDTFKIGHSDSSLSAIYHGLFDNRIYTGFNFLFRALAKCNDGFDEKHPNIAVISASPRQLHNKIQKMFAYHDFPPVELLLSDWLDDRSTYQYKLENSKQIAQRHNKPILFFGDDTQFDPAVYHEMKKLLGDRVLGIYIHQITGKDGLPESTEKIGTAFDIAVKAMKKNLITKTEVLQVAEEILDVTDLGEIVPDFAVCPESQVDCSEFSADAQMTTTCEKVKDRIAEACANK